MGKGNRPTTCSVTTKRLRAKSWYYRNGKYYYNKRAWEQEKAKVAKETPKETAKPAAAEAAPEAGAKS